MRLRMGVLLSLEFEGRQKCLSLNRPAVMPHTLALLLFLSGLLLPAATGISSEAGKPLQPEKAESRALAFLAREVPSWSVKHKCYSCHNNGDAAKALYQAVRLSYPVPAEALTDTTRWLSLPGSWDENKGDPAFSDKALARIHFAAALSEAMNAKLVKDREVLIEAARLVVEHQQSDGSWKVEQPGNIGSPVTYGACLATAIARQTLHKADGFSKEIARADDWLRKARAENVLDAAGILIGLEKYGDAERSQVGNCLTLLLRSQSRAGGWGPYAKSPPEPFDTAVAILALSKHRVSPEIKKAIQRGREFLLESQLKDGSWQETTRPPGGES
jgi:hypothetical protein